jgi:hypothetical protein
MADARQRQIAIVAIGVGRSGTSVLARGLQALGVDLGPSLRPSGGKNPTGFFEDTALLALNQRLKRLLGIRGASVRPIEPNEWEAPALAALRAEAITTVRERFGSYPLWGYKYARTLRLLPFWLEVYAACDLDIRYVVTLRHPISVARSRARLDPRRGTQEKSDLEWLANVVPHFRLAAQRPFVVVDYDRLMADPSHQLERIARGLALPLNQEVRESIRQYGAEFLVPSMRHSHFSEADLASDKSVNPLTRAAYLWLLRLADDEAEPHEPNRWREWQSIEDRVTELAPVLRHIDRVEEERRRARRHPLGPLQIAPEVWRKLRER